MSILSFFKDEGKGSYPLYVSDNHYGSSADLLYWQGHFAIITSFERFRATITKSTVQKSFCRR